MEKVEVTEADWTRFKEFDNAWILGPHQLELDDKEVLRILARHRIEATRANDEDIARYRAALGRIADRSAALKGGTDDWFELVEFEQVARKALKDAS